MLSYFGFSIDLNQYIYTHEVQGASVYILYLAPCTSCMYLIYSIVANLEIFTNFEPELRADKRWTAHTKIHAF